MVLIYVISLLFLSCFCSFILNSQYIALTFFILASNQMVVQFNTGSHVNSNLVYAVLFTAMLQFLNTFLSAKQNKSFLWILLLPIAYILTVFFIKPYKINMVHYLGYLAALFTFARVMLLKWDSRKIVEFLTIYGSYLIFAGLLEKIVINSPRIGLVTYGPVAYSVVLVVIWTIWIINALLSKMYSMKIIFIGTFLTFFAIILSGTRMGLLGFFMGIGLCLLSATLIKRNNINIIKIAAYSAGILVLLLFLSVITWKLLPDDLFIKQTLSTILVGKLDKSNTGRVFAWITAINTFEQHKFFGIGPGNFYEKMKIFLNSIGINSKIIQVLLHAHNIYLIVLSEHGIIGFLILAFFVFFCMLQIFLYFLKNRNSPEFYGVFAGFMVMATLGFVDAIPMYLPTSCFAAWLLGVASSYKFKNEFDAKAVGKHTKQ